MIVENYGKAFISEITCLKWFQCYKSGNFDMKDKQRPRPLKKFEDTELGTLDGDTCQI